MKKLMTVLLTVLMVVSLGVVNVAGEETEKVREDALPIIQAASTLLTDATNDSLVPHSIKYVVDGKEMDELPKGSHTLNLFELDDEDKKVLYTSHVIISDDYDASLLIDYLYSQFIESGKERYKDVFRLVCHKYEHVHNENCYVQVCRKHEHTHDDDCYTIFDNVVEIKGYGYFHKELKCKKHHEHNDDCYKFTFITRELGKYDSYSDNTLKMLTCHREEHTHDDNCYRLNCHREEHTHDIGCYDVFLPLITQKYFTIDDISMVDGDKVISLEYGGGYIYSEINYDGKDHINTIDLEVDLDGVDYDCVWRKEDSPVDEMADAGEYTALIQIENYLYLEGDLYSGYTPYSYAFVYLEINQLRPLFVASDLYGDYYLYSTDSILTLNNKKGEALIGNYEDAIAAGATGVEYTLDGDTWNEALVKTYVGKDGKKLYYIELALESEDADQTLYEIRFKTAEESANNFSTSQFNVDSKEYAQDFNNLPSLEFYKGEPKENEIIVSYNVDEEEYEDLVPYEFSEDDFKMTGCYPTYVSVGNTILEYGKDYVLCVYGDKEEANGLLNAAVKEPYMAIRFTDNYLKSLKSGTHNFRLHIGFVELEYDYFLFSTFSYFDGQIKVKKHHVPDDDTPSYKVVATGIE